MSSWPCELSVMVQLTGQPSFFSATSTKNIVYLKHWKVLYREYDNFVTIMTILLKPEVTCAMLNLTRNNWILGQFSYIKEVCFKTWLKCFYREFSEKIVTFRPWRRAQFCHHAAAIKMESATLVSRVKILLQKVVKLVVTSFCKRADFSDFTSNAHGRN